MRKVPAAVPSEGVEVVATHAAQDAWEAMLDFFGVIAQEALGLSVDVALVARATAGNAPLRLREQVEARQGAVRQDHLLFEDVVDRLPIFDRPRSAGVIAHHPAQGGAVAGRNIRREPEAVRLELLVQLVKHHARLHPRGVGGGVDGEHAVQVRRVVHHHAGGGGLTREAGACTPREQRHPPLSADRDDGRHVFGVSWNHYAGGDHLVDAGVRRIEQPRGVVEANVPPDARPELSRQFGKLRTLDQRRLDKRGGAQLACPNGGQAFCVLRCS